MSVPDAVLASAVTGCLLLASTWIQQRYSSKGLTTQLEHERTMRERERLVRAVSDFNSAALNWMDSAASAGAVAARPDLPDEWMREVVLDLNTQSLAMRTAYAKLVLICSNDLRQKLREIYRPAEEQMKTWMAISSATDPKELERVIATYSSALGALLPHLRAEVGSEPGD